MLVLLGLSGILETLPILASLPLLRTLFMNLDYVQFSSFSWPIFRYSSFLLILLSVRFIIGTYAQYQSAKTRLNLISNYRTQFPNASKFEIITTNKRAQGLNFFFVGFSQLIPGLFFSILGLFLSPTFGILVFFILTIWLFPMSFIKQLQDKRHQEVTKSSKFNDNDRVDWGGWNTQKRDAAKLDALNKNLREFVVITTLLSALFIATRFTDLSKSQSIFTVLMYLRGLQQLFTAYIMSQQLTSLKSLI